jgi:hypothetical protein
MSERCCVYKKMIGVGNEQNKGVVEKRGYTIFSCLMGFDYLGRVRVALLVYYTRRLICSLGIWEMKWL